MEEKVTMEVSIGLSHVKALKNFLDKNDGTYEDQHSPDESELDGANEGGPEGTGSSDITQQEPGPAQ